MHRFHSMLINFSTQDSNVWCISDDTISSELGKSDFQVRMERTIIPTHYFRGTDILLDRWRRCIWTGLNSKSSRVKVTVKEKRPPKRKARLFALSV